MTFRGIMQHRIKVATVASLCAATVGIHGGLYALWKRDVTAIVRAEVRSEVQPLREDIRSAHMRLDQHLAVR